MMTAELRVCRTPRRGRGVSRDDSNGRPAPAAAAPAWRAAHSAVAQLPAALAVPAAAAAFAFAFAAAAAADGTGSCRLSPASAGRRLRQPTDLQPLPANYVPASAAPRRRPRRMPGRGTS